MIIERWKALDDNKVLNGDRHTVDFVSSMFTAKKAIDAHVQDGMTANELLLPVLKNTLTALALPNAARITSA